jgi:hypothetical protein
MGFLMCWGLFVRVVCSVDIVDCLCLDHFVFTRKSLVCMFVVCVGGLCGKLVRAHGGCLGIESR